jgi:myo-inositol-1(or 4)-monophosphatase
MPIEKLLQFAESIVREAGKDIKGMTKHSRHMYSKEEEDLVTAGDLSVQEHVMGRIRDVYPDHAIISEESDEYLSEPDYLWILDPIDGTKYFARKVPVYAISLALKIKGEIMLGVVHAPDIGQTFCAGKGIGATLNGQPIECSRQNRLDNSFVCVEIPSRHSPPEELDEAMRKVHLLIGEVQRLRIIGVTSLGLSWTAMGGFDAYVNLGSDSRIWDWAAGQIILKESGGLMTRSSRCLVSGSQDLCKKIREVLDIPEKVE